MPLSPPLHSSPRPLATPPRLSPPPKRSQEEAANSGINSELWIEYIVSDAATDSNETLREKIDVQLSRINATIAPQGFTRKKSEALQLEGRKINVKFMPIQGNPIDFLHATHLARIATPNGGVLRGRMNPNLLGNIGLCPSCFTPKAHGGHWMCYCTHANGPAQPKRAARENPAALRRLLNM